MTERESFGGNWSGEKLSALESYLKSYTTALKNTTFKLAYIDAFAGSGLRRVFKDENPCLLEDSDVAEDEHYRHGSPLIALDIDPPFDAFIFIERDADSMASLQSQVEERWPGRNIRYLQGDANEHLQELCEKDWGKHRAVAFLDPFALQVNWNTLEKISQTQAIDLWLLFPAMAVNRMLPRSGKIPPRWAERLNLLFGEDKWRDAFYSTPSENLFGEEVTEKNPQIFDILSRYVTERLAQIFSGTHDKPLILKNRTGAPLFLLCFACGSKKGAKIATRIASHIINTSRHG